MAPDEPGAPGGPDRAAEAPLIHVDSDWKREAQAEKERLARELEREPKAPPPGQGPAAGPAAAAMHGEEGRLPAPSFVGLVQSLATQAAIFLSDQVDPETGETLRNLDLAKYNIDLLGVLEEKTAGNLTDEEKRVLDTMLYELRMAYISTAG